MTERPHVTSPATWDRLAVLFDLVTSQPAHARAACLADVCSGDAALQTELSGLLAAADQAPDFLGGLADHVMSPAFLSAAAESETQERTRATEVPTGTERPLAVGVGTWIRHFEVLAPLGAGGMGIVYRGRDHRLNREVALKFLPPTVGFDSAAHHRLVREAQAASSLDDPHVCAVYAIEDMDDGGLCLVMAYCSGGTLRDRLRAGPLTVGEATDILRQIASGLASAHRIGLVHRDIKPANIGFGERGIAKILDFGVAVRGGPDAALDTTEESPLAGTLPYMAPELLRGHPADAAADIWALGVVYSEMLTGRRPFAAPTHAALLHDILEREPATLTGLDGVPIPDEAETLVREMLQKSSATRPRDGDALLQRLRTSVPRNDAGAQRSASPFPTPNSASVVHRSTRRSTRRWAGVAVGLAALAVIPFATRRAPGPLATAPLQVIRSAEPLPTIAVLPFTVRGRKDLEYLREGMMDVLAPALDATGLLRSVDPNTILGAASQLTAAIIDSATARSLAQRVGAQRYLTGSVVQTGTMLTMRATLHYADGSDVARAQVTVNDADGLLLGAESLVRQLVASELRAPGDTLAGMAAAMTTSKRALRAYIDGERELRDARPAAAMTFFAQSVVEDSLFALGWYRLARAARWSEVDSVNARATARAFALASTLPLRLQQLVQAYYALRVGSPVSAERQLSQIVADYPNDVDAWMLLGESRFDHHQYSGRPTAEATEAFGRVMSLDPQNREVTVYLMELASRAGRIGALDTLFQMYFRPNSAGEQPGVRATYLTLHARRVRRVQRPIDDLAGAQLALRRAGAEPSDLQAAESFASTLAANTSDPVRRVEGLLALATLDIAAGRFGAAGQRWRDAARLDADATQLHRALLHAAPSVPVSVDTLDALRQWLWRTPTVDAGRTRLMTPAEDRALRVYLAGLLSVRLKDTTELQRAQQQLARYAQTAVATRLSNPLSYALQGHLARLRGDELAAVAAFARSVVEVPSDVRSHAPALGQQADRYAHAEALRALGRTEAARPWYQSLRDGPGLMSAPYLVLSAQGVR